MDKQEIWGILGYALDMTKIGQVKWTKESSVRFSNKTLCLELYESLVYNKITCTYKSENITEIGGELVQRLYKYVSNRFG